MTGPLAVIRWLGRRRPRTIRLRLSVLYAALFLAGGALLLALTYGLLASSLPRSTLTPSEQDKLANGCNQTKLVAQLTCRQLNRAATQAAESAAANQRDRALHDLLLFSLLGLAAMTVVSGGLGWVMAGRVLRPVSAITGAARRASQRHLGERIELKGPKDELKELADTFDDMLDRLDAAFAGQRRFIADASHELRTPLTVMRTAIDVTLAKPTRSPQQLEAMAVKVRRSLAQAEGLIDALLTLAISEHELPSKEFVDLATLVEDALDTAAPRISERALAVTAKIEPAETSGDRLLLERLIANLIHNAIRHNHPRGWLRVETGRTQHHTYVEIANSGDVIAEQTVQSLFEPFRRIQERINTTDGVGLGLAIVKSIAAAHHAHIDAHAQPQGGIAIRITLHQDPRPALAVPWER